MLPVSEISKLGFEISMLQAQDMINEANDFDPSGEVTFADFVGKIMKNQ